MKQIVTLSLMAVLSFSFTACTSSNPLPDSPSFKLGEKDGCATASGSYTKNSDTFNNNTDYANGWFYGRKNCNPVQSQT